VVSCLGQWLVLVVSGQWLVVGVRQWFVVRGFGSCFRWSVAPGSAVLDRRLTTDHWVESQPDYSSTTIAPEISIKSIARVYYKRSELAHPAVVDKAVVGDDHDTVGCAQLLVS
jgi:hypothetical protein